MYIYFKPLPHPHQQVYVNYFRFILPVLDNSDRNWRHKLVNNEIISPEDLEPLVKLFQDYGKKMKEKYGKYCINRPLSEYIISEFEDYFNVNIYI